MDSKNLCNYYKNPNCAICAGPLSDETVKDHDHQQASLEVLHTTNVIYSISYQNLFQ